MRKLLALVLVVSLGLFVWTSIKDQGVEDVAAAYQYQVDRIRDVTRIEILEAAKAKIVLQRNKDHWLLNERYRARQNAMENLLTALEKVELQFIPQPQAVKNIMPVIQRAGVTVNIYDGKDQKMQSYILGGVTPDERGTYVLKSGYDQPAVVTLPGFEGSLMPRFQMSLKDWRDRTVLSATVDQIESLSVQYPNQPAQSFAIARAGKNNWAISQLGLSSEKSPIVIEGAIEAYLRAYKSLGAEDIILNDELNIELQKKNPFVIIELEKRDGGAQSVALYPLKISESAPVVAQIERYQVLDKEGNLFLIQHRVFEEIFWGYDQFLAKD